MYVRWLANCMQKETGSQCRIKREGRRCRHTQASSDKLRQHLLCLPRRVFAQAHIANPVQKQLVSELVAGLHLCQSNLATMSCRPRLPGSMADCHAAGHKPVLLRQGSDKIRWEGAAERQCYSN